MAESASGAGTDRSSPQTFRAVVDAEPVQQTVALVRALVDECRVSLGADGIRVRAMDPATVAAVDLDLDEAAFESYESTGGRIGVDLERLGEVVGMADADQRVRFALDPETRTLRVEIGGLEYTLGLLDPQTVRSPPDLSELTAETAGEAVVAAGELDRAVRAADMVAGHVAFGIDGDEETFSVEASGDTDGVSLVRPAEDLVSLTPEDAHALFSVEYLKAIDREIPRGTEVSLRLGTEQPLAASYEFADGAGSVEYLISPRISRR